MKKVRAAIVGYGNIGHYVLEALQAAPDFEIAGVVRRAGAENKPEELANYAVYALRANLERSAKSYMDLAQLQYINGVINYLDVLDAQRGYFDAQIGLSNAIRDELITVVQLYKALGGGWKQ